MGPSPPAEALKGRKVSRVLSLGLRQGGVAMAPHLSPSFLCHSHSWPPPPPPVPPSSIQIYFTIISFRPWLWKDGSPGKVIGESVLGS